MKKKKFDEIIEEINNLAKLNDIVLIAIDGKSCSGKTSLAHQISMIIDCNIIHIDDYFLPRSQVDEKSNEHAKNIDFKRLKNEVIIPINNKDNFIKQPYLCDVQELGNKEMLTLKKVNIVEGAYSMHPELIEIYQYKIFLNISSLKQKYRVLKRNGFKKYKVFLNKWIPNENRYILELDIIKKADVVIY
jgi:uridine kinase